MARVTIFAALAAGGTVLFAADFTRAGATSPMQGQTRNDSVVTLLAAGDIAACTGGSVATARILDSIPGEVIIPGDAAYGHRRREPNPYVTCFDTTWGRHKSRIRPVPGNHDHEPSFIRKYFAYFGEAAGPEPGGYYSFDYGRWHIIALNSNIDIGSRSRQGKWLAADLAANRSKCTLAFMHHPRFSSGPHQPHWTTRAAYRLLDSADVDVIVTGHDHIYERFAPMDVDGKPSDTAPRQFVVGTGGAGLYDIARPGAHSEARTDQHFGILKLTLEPDSYAWEFVNVQGFGFRDSGSSRCH